MNTCSQIRSSLGLLLDGELPPERAEAIRSHLEDCPACREERRQLEKLDGAMRSFFMSEAAHVDAAGFWRGVQQRVETDGQSPFRRWFEQAGAAIRAPSLVWAVPAVLALVVGGLYFDVFSRSWSSGGTRNSFATVESIDAYGRNVALWREHESKTTVIWIYQTPENEDEAAGEVPDKGPAF
jgi:predicted anti-sigma-YlaC factor YlaD